MKFPAFQTSCRIATFLNLVLLITTKFPWVVHVIQVIIKATGPSSAEMVTDEGAIYVTSNNGYNWKAAVEETVSATLNR